jgi:ATP-dependent RNA helicase RhlB
MEFRGIRAKLAAFGAPDWRQQTTAEHTRCTKVATKSAIFKRRVAPDELSLARSPLLANGMSERTLTDIDFASFALHPSLLSSLHQANFTRLTPIQALTLPVALAGKDVAGEAQTGTGKTAAFLVAAMQKILTTPAKAERRPQDPRVVVMAPTRELAVQIQKDALQLSGATDLRIAVVFGGVDYDKQRKQFDDGVDILIGTPGRLIDYYKQDVFSLKRADVMVLDEADRMFDLGFIADVRYVMRRLPAREERLTMMFSATLSLRVLELAYEHMNEPTKLTADAGSKTAARVTQSVYFPAAEEKMPLLLGILATLKPVRAIVFVNTKHVAERIQRALERAQQLTGVLSGDVPQRKRLTLLERFKKGEIEILVATDVAARGLHIPDVSHVINFDLPFDAEDYVHRIGRTARFGSLGSALSFACEQYAVSLPDIERYIDTTIPRASVTDALLSARPEARAGAKAMHAAEAQDRAGMPAVKRPKSRRRGGGSGQRSSRSSAATPSGAPGASASVLPAKAAPVES